VYKLASDIERLDKNLGQLPEAVAKPIFIIISGLPGTGKSYFSGKLAERLPLITLESDALRKVLFAKPTYHPEESKRLFSAIHRLIEQLLKKGISLVLDATNLLERHREYFYSIADHLGVKLILVRVETPPEVVQERILQRKPSESKSDADWRVYENMRYKVQAIGRNHYVVDTSKDITPVLNKIVREARH
jgi:predicted kinase